MRVRLATPADDAAIAAYVDAHPGATPFHRLEWGRAVAEGCRQRAHVLVAEKPLPVRGGVGVGPVHAQTGSVENADIPHPNPSPEGEGLISGVLPLTEIHSPLFGRALVASGYAVGGGILCDDDANGEALAAEALALAARTSVPGVELRGGYLPQEWERDETTYLGFVRDLAADDEAELLAIPRKQRAEVRRALGFDLTVDLGDRDVHYRTYATSVRNLGTPVFPRALFDAVLDAFGDDADVLTVRKDGVPLASVLSLYHRGTVMPYWGGGTADARTWRANDLMYFALMRHARERGCTRFDFGRSKAGTGAAAFKRNWGFEGEPLVYASKTLDGKAKRSVNPLDPKYSLQVRLWSKLPLPVANRLGPLIARGAGVNGDEILFLSHRLPWPPDRGDRIRSWHMFEALAQLRPVHVIAPLDDVADRQHIAKVESLAASVTTAVRPASKGAAVARGLLSGRPASVELFSLPELHRALHGRLATGKIGTVFAFSGQMAHYVPRDINARFVMDFVDMDSAKFAQQAETAGSPLARLALRTEARRLLAFEIATARRADTSLFVSRAEADLFTARTGMPAQVIENGVDLVRFAPGAVDPEDAPRPLIVFTGQMDYAPNIEAVTRFAHDVMPSLPGATFAIVGRAPTAPVRALASPGVIVTGEVPDTRPWLAAADVVVAPLALARGIQNKVLEAMAMGKAVVASTPAAEGIDAEPGRDLLVADAPEAMASVIGGLLADPLHARTLGTNARDRMVARYSWRSCLAPLAELIR